MTLKFGNSGIAAFLLSIAACSGDEVEDPFQPLLDASSSGAVIGDAGAAQPGLPGGSTAGGLGGGAGGIAFGQHNLP